MLVRLGQPTDHGFDSPLGLLGDCHRRIERFLAVLLTVTGARRGGPLGDQDRHVLDAALRYFRTAAPRHSEDEEHSLFPRLRASRDQAAAQALETVTRLEADHRTADRHHAAVDTLVTQWMADGTLPAGSTARLLEHLTALELLYRAHIAVEDGELFPAAARILDAADLQAIGREMAGRRGVSYEPPPGLADGRVASAGTEL